MYTRQHGLAANLFLAPGETGEPVEPEVAAAPSGPRASGFGLLSSE
jgi:hypothetical protein